MRLPLSLIGRGFAGPQRGHALLSRKAPFPVGVSSSFTPRRPFYEWLNAIFNQVDSSRIEAVGPDRACAEWLLRCGAKVVWQERPNRVLSDYNSLPAGNFRGLHLAEIDATDSGVMEAGFEHLRDCKKLTKIKFKNCVYVTDDSLGFLTYCTREQLEWLEVSDNGNVTDAGLRCLGRLQKLRFLRLENLPAVEEPQKVMDLIREKLPDLEIEWPPFTEEKEGDGGGDDEKK